MKEGWAQNTILVDQPLVLNAAPLCDPAQGVVDSNVYPNKQQVHCAPFHHDYLCVFLNVENAGVLCVNKWARRECMRSTLSDVCGDERSGPVSRSNTFQGGGMYT